MTTIAYDCERVAEHAAEYVERRLPKAAAAAIDAHLANCDACSESLRYSRAVHGLISYVNADRPAPAPASVALRPMESDAAVEYGAKPSYIDRFGAAPWWLVSLSMHVLIIVLATLVSISYEPPSSDDGVIMVTELSRPATLDQDKEKPRNPDTALDSKLETRPADPTSKEASDIVIPPDILAKAELGDHFETINPDRPDTHSAFGCEDAKMFHSVTGNAEPAGGGGMGGLSLEDVIGVGGAASKGKGGGFGGGDGTGAGAGSGAGKGSFGQRLGSGRKSMVKRHGGSPATENAVDKALEWLAYHQEPDGSWEIAKHGGSLPPTCGVGVTALATLAFLGAGHTERVGAYKENVQRAVGWLISKQKDTGEIGDNSNRNGWATGSGYSHPIAGMALAEAFAMARNPKTGEAAQKAVYFSVEQYWDPKTKTWHYGLPGSYPAGYDFHTNGDDNISVIAWFVMQLKSAKIAGLHFDHAGCYRSVSEWLDQLMPQGQKDGYGDHRYGYGMSKQWNEPSHANTAMALVCRLFMGMPPNELETGSDFVSKEVPKWDAKNGETDAPRGPCPHYYWYYGTLAMFQIGGDSWKKWNEALKATLVPNQRRDGDFAGSWDLLGSDGPYGGRAYTTAMGALCLEVYYRYLQLSPEKER